MPKRYELSLKANYLPGWDTWCGIRELVQNARDAEVQDHAPMKIEHVFRIRNQEPVGTLIICNEGTTIPLEAFLIGHTSKSGRSDLLGKFGEGFKFGILALLRLGLRIKIRNGDQSWTPLIVRSKDYDAEVLAFDVASGNSFENRVQIEILGISLEDWEQMKERFLFLNPPHPASVVNVHGGKVLLSPQYKGMLFVKGMFVYRTNQLFYGYDVDEADIDRDRRMINDVNIITSKLLAGAVASGKLIDKVYDLLISGSPETSGISSYYIEEEAREALVDKFHQQYGKEALPAESEDQVVELANLGVRGIRLPWNLQNIISAKLGDARVNIARLKMNARHTFERSELTDLELDVLDKAKIFLHKALSDNNFPVDLIDNIKIVEFNDQSTQGTYSSHDKTTRLARHVLENLPKTICVLIHEFANYSGTDGSKAHKHAIFCLAKSVFSYLLN